MKAYVLLCLSLSLACGVMGNYKIRKMENTINHVFIELGKFRRDLAFVETRVNEMEETIWNLTETIENSPSGSSTERKSSNVLPGNEMASMGVDVGLKMRMALHSLSKEKLLIRNMMRDVEKVIRQGSIGEELEDRLSKLERRVDDGIGQFDFVENPRKVHLPKNGNQGDVKFSFSTRLDKSRDIIPDPKARRLGHRMHSKVIPFSDVIHNDGDVYNPVTGKFTCKKDGVYLFVFFVEGIFRNNRPVNGQTSMAAISVDGKYQTLAASKAFSSDGRNTGGNSVILKLIKGQQVWLETVAPISQMITLREWVSTFSGVLLY